MCCLYGTAQAYLKGRCIPAGTTGTGGGGAAAAAGGDSPDARAAAAAAQMRKTMPLRSRAIAMALQFAIAACDGLLFSTFSDASCTKTTHTVSGNPGDCLVLDYFYSPISVKISSSYIIERWTNVFCSGSQQSVIAVAPNTCTAMFGAFGEVFVSSPSPSPSPAPSKNTNGFFALLIFPLVMALVAARCFCCPLERTVTGEPVASRRHTHALRYTVTQDPCGDCLNSIKSNGYQRREPAYTFKDLRCAACGQLTRQLYACEQCQYYECAACFTAAGGGAAVAPAVVLPSAPPELRSGGYEALDDPSADPA